MRDLYNQAALQSSRAITRLYSTSFTWGICALHPQLRDPIYSIYGLVRLADEIVDTFPEINQAQLLDELETATYQALDRGISVNPVLQSFQHTVRCYAIDRDLVTAFFESMRMDLARKTHNPESFSKYIFGSAEVVGLMCLKVFCHGNNQLYNELSTSARKLGAAFQKVNFLRDLKSDFEERGRIYFPGIAFETFSRRELDAIVADIEKDFDEALEGIRRLPKQSRQGVYLAYCYFRRLLNKIRNSSPQQVREQRIRINNGHKLWLLAQVYVRTALGMI
ncbi:MAG: phytoene/squalene synthase family protein [Chitinophagales bacterium]|nr:phytoene/squalene synthase family protein [Chitinophagales bacterium]MDW8427651.1 phytoene/squalene synthase family protein [Chitinophagales bacterium]